MNTQVSPIQQAIDVIEGLTPEDQALVINVIRRRLIEQRRAELIQEVQEARLDYEIGDFVSGTVDELLMEFSA